MKPEKRTHARPASEELLVLLQQPGDIRSKAARASKLADEVHAELKAKGITQ